MWSVQPRLRGGRELDWPRRMRPIKSGMHWFGRRRRMALALICALCTGAIIATVTFRSSSFVNSIWLNETSFRDALERRGSRTKAHDEFVFLGIDEASKQLDQL